MVLSASQEMVEIRWHARAGQGAVTAAKLTAEAALAQGMHFQAFPEYGPERTGAPIQAFTRISPNPIHVHSNVEHPQVAVVLDPTLLSLIDVSHGMPDDGIIIINTDKSPAEIREISGIKGRTIYTVNANTIARETIGRAIPNTPMLGALVRTTGMFELDGIVDDLRRTFSKKFTEAVVEGNVQAVTRAYQEVAGE